MRWDQIKMLEPGDVLMNKDTLQVCEVCSLWMDKANCLLYNVNRSLVLDRKELRHWFIYRRYSNKSQEQLKRKI